MADEIKKVEKEISKEVKKMGINFWAVASIVLALILIGVLIFNFATAGISGSTAGQKVLKFIADQSQGNVTNVSIVSVTSQGSVYQVVVLMQGQQIPVYVTKDGKSLIPPNGLIPLQAQAANSNTNANANTNANSNTPAQTSIPKSSKPVIELFVMAYCPYGTQEEKGLIPVLNLLKDKVDFQLKFVYYSMHQSQVDEVGENTRQYCIQKEQQSKLIPYLTCFLSTENSSTCLTQTGVNQAQLTACVAAADTQFKITANVKDTASYLSGQFPKYDVNLADNQKYSVAGSPTLIINGVESQSNRDSESLLQSVCGAFATAPAECSQTLSSAAPSPGFGSGTAASGSTTAGCATPTA